MFKLLRNFTRKDWGLVVLCLALSVFQVWLDLRLPDYMATITRLVQTEGSAMDEILQNGGLMLLCALGSLAGAVATGFCTAQLAARFSRTLRSKLFRKVESLATHEVKTFSVSSLITRTTNDITQIEMLLAFGLQMIIKAPIMAVWAISKILGKSWQWSLITAVGVAVLMLTISVIMLVVVPRFKLVQRLIDRLNGVTRENLSGIRVVRAFNAETYQENKFARTNADLTNTQLFNQRMFSLIQPTMNMVMYGLTFGIYFLGAYLIQAAGGGAKLTLFSDMVVFSSYAMQVLAAFIMLTLIFMIWPRAEVSAERIGEVLDAKETIRCGRVEAVTTSAKTRGLIEFRNVSFKYPNADRYMLRNIDFTAEPGQTVAIIGATGSGKSTLINLIPRLYDITKGEILVDGINVADYDLDTLGAKLGYVSQKAVLFSGTIASNVAMGSTFDTPSWTKAKIAEQVKSALKVAQAWEFVSKLPHTIYAHVAQGGSNFSGGQKQRLSIARAVARDPEIYIFDDSFSALDYQTDAKLRRALAKHSRAATKIIVAQRIGTILHADKILVLDQGRLVGQGTHAELLRNCKVYREIAESQLSPQELANAGLQPQDNTGIERQGNTKPHQGSVNKATAPNSAQKGVAEVAKGADGGKVTVPNPAQKGGQA